MCEGWNEQGGVDRPRALGPGPNGPSTTPSAATASGVGPGPGEWDCCIARGRTDRGALCAGWRLEGLGAAQVRERHLTSSPQ